MKKVLNCPFVYFFPVLVLSFRADTVSIIISCVIYVLTSVLFVVSKPVTGIKDCIKIRNASVAALINIFLGYLFWNHWKPSSVFKTAADLIHVPVSVFVVTASIIIVIASLPGVCAFISKLNSVAVLKNENVTVGKNKTSLELTDVVFVIALSVFVGCFALFRPLGDYRIGTDEAVFMYIGKQMHNGFVAYNDLFDHKGILLYFIQYLGFSITRSSLWGIWIVCVANFAAFLLISTKTMKLIIKNKFTIYITEFLSCLFFIVTLGKILNNSEGFALPWIALALYVFVKYFTKKQYKFSDIVLVGVSFAVILFLRCNMIGVFIASIPVILFDFIKEKKWTDIWKCALALLSGCAVVIIPLMVYFWKTDSLAKMFEYYIDFNFLYTSDVSVDDESKVGIFRAMMFFAVTRSVFWVASLGCFTTYKKDRTYWILHWNYAVSLFCASISGRVYAHYSYVLLPMELIMLLYFVNQFTDNVMPVMYKSRLLKTGVVLSMLFSSVLMVEIMRPVKTDVKIIDTTPGFNGVPEYVAENTGESDDILFIGNAVQYYFYTNRTTNNRFFFQSPPANESKKIFNEFEEELSVHPSDFIIVPGSYEDNNESRNEPLNLFSIIDSLDGYRLIKFDDFCVYEKTANS